MAIVKRTTPAERFKQTLSDDWRDIFYHPMLQALTNPRFTYCFDSSTENLQDVLAQFHQARWITSMAMDDKIVIYILCTLLRRVYQGRSLLDDTQYSMLDRHLNAASTMEKIDAMDGVSFAARQCIAWDLPRFREHYPKNRAMDLPRPPHVTIKVKPLLKPVVKPKPVIKKLAKHKKI